MSGRPRQYVDMDSLSPDERTLAVLRDFESLYAKFLDSWNIETGEYSGSVRSLIQHMVSWLKENFDLEVLSRMIRTEKMRLGEDLIEILKNPLTPTP